MSETHHETLWRGFPKTLLEFEERFGTEVACREYLAACRWNGRPRCGRCDSDHVWSERGGMLYECAQCGHQTSLTSGTLFHGTRCFTARANPYGSGFGRYGRSACIAMESRQLICNVS